MLAWGCVGVGRRALPSRRAAWLHGGGTGPGCYPCPGLSTCACLRVWFNSFAQECLLKMQPSRCKPHAILPRRLREGVEVVVGTPGRIIDFVESGKLSLDQVVIESVAQMYAF